MPLLHQGWQRSTGKERSPAVGYHPEPKKRLVFWTRLIPVGQGYGQARSSAAAQLSKDVAVPKCPSLPLLPHQTALIPYTHQHQRDESMGDQEQLYLGPLLAEADLQSQPEDWGQHAAAAVRNLLFLILFSYLLINVMKNWIKKRSAGCYKVLS